MDTGEGSDAFWSRVQKGNPDECWVWCGSVWKARGYGRFRGEWAHRFAWADAAGHEPPEDKPLILHSCDNGRCVNPAHLRPGTHAENMRDRAARRRTARGERVGGARLNAEKVLEIRERRARGEKLDAIARALGVAVMTVHGVTSGRNWAHVLPPTSSSY